MIRCNHCGKLAPAGASSCQNCGMPLVSASGGAGMANGAQSEQSELPAWLESLRAHERPASSGMGGQPFSMAELVDENAMPSWMRQDQSRLRESSDAFPALSSTAKPGLSPERQAFPASGLEASSLIDEQSLPSWMRGQESGQPGAGQSVSGNGLVEQESLPAWMKNLAQTAQPQPPTRPMAGQYGLPPQVPATPSPAVGGARMPHTPSVPGGYSDMSQPPTQGFLANSLVDQQSLPGWMTGAQGPGQQGQSRPVPTESGFAAGELIDQRSLPTWMKDQQGQDKSNSGSAMGVPVNGSGQGMGQDIQGGVGMPASALLNMDSMPAWMREGEQGGANAGYGQGAQQPMAAGSLIDMSTLPTWLRNADSTPQQGGGARGGQTRNEGMRVPSRPRAEVGPQEQSEVAANVFASMLGVSASAPQLPGQTQAPVNNLGVAQGQQAQAQPAIPGWQYPPQSEVKQGAQPQAWQLSGPLPQLPYMAGGQAEGVSGKLPGQMGEKPGYMGSAETYRAGVGPAEGVGGNSNGETQAAEAKKKGFFDSIRDFFFK